MEELIKVTNNEGRQLVSARELHEFLGIGSQYSIWFDRMCGYGFAENTDFVAINQKRLTAQGNETTFVDHAMSIEMAKEISMIQRTDKGREARKYFIECERKLKEVLTSQLPQDYLSALKALVVAEEQKALMQPQVEYYQKVLNPNAQETEFVKYMTVSAIAKDLGMSAQKLNKILHEKEIIYKQSDIWYFYAKYEDRIPEYADYVVTEYGQTLKFSEKGREWIIDLIQNS